MTSFRIYASLYRSNDHDYIGEMSRVQHLGDHLGLWITRAHVSLHNSHYTFFTSLGFHSDQRSFPKLYTCCCPVTSHLTNLPLIPSVTPAQWSITKCWHGSSIVLGRRSSPSDATNDAINELTGLTYYTLTDNQWANTLVPSPLAALMWLCDSNQ